MYNVVLGCDKADAGSVSAGGKNIISNHSIVCKLFVDVEEVKYTEDYIENLKDCIKNRIAL